MGTDTLGGGLPAPGGNSTFVCCALTEAVVSKKATTIEAMLNRFMTLSLSVGGL
jgi:hypothetical protein